MVSGSRILGYTRAHINLRSTMLQYRQRLELVACNYLAGNVDSNQVAEVQFDELIKEPRSLLQLVSLFGSD